MTSLQNYRQTYQPKLPKMLKNLQEVGWKAEAKLAPLPSALQKFLPHSESQSIIKAVSATQSQTKPLRVGVVLSGGQAPGGHNVISGLFDALKKLHPQSRLFGFLDGPKGITDKKYKEITQEVVDPYRNQGGFDIIGSGRTKLETEEQFLKAEQTVRSLGLDGLVIVGGDDSNTNAALLADFFISRGCSTKVVGVPKTIDGDLKNEHVEISFGFDTAAKTYAETIGSIMRDALSAKKYYYFIKLMGRSASHITLECALQTCPNYTLISEEVAANGWTLEHIIREICDLICMRAQKGKDYGIILLPEGVIEFIPEFEAHCTGVERDPHGNVQVSKIETERLFIELVKEELKKRGNYKGKFSAQPHFCGYEGRSCFPSNFDCLYCYALGHTAALLIKQGVTGYMSCIQGLKGPVENWRPQGVPLASMMTLETREGKERPVIKKSLVDLNGTLFREFKAVEKIWREEDYYAYPGPIQFFGPTELTESITMTLQCVVNC